MWKIPDGYFYTTWEYLSIKEVNNLLILINILLSASGIGYIFTEKNYLLPIYSLSLGGIVVLNGLYFHHDIFTIVILFLLIFIENKYNRSAVNSFAASVMLMSGLSKLNTSFLKGETIIDLIPVKDERILTIIVVCIVIFELTLALYYWGLIRNKLLKLIFIAFHYFMGLLLMRGLVFNALFVFLIERKGLDSGKKQLKNYPYFCVYFGVSFFTILFRIISSQL
tara:strand:- start:9918 stop:10589 length:672 start_codon:yes stop_codon:yes gene_type:complete